MASLNAGTSIVRRRSRFFPWLIFLVFVSVLSVPVQASIHAWGCLLYASNAGRGSDLPPPLARYEVALRRSLGYSSYRVVSQREIAVESWVNNLLVAEGDIQVILTSLSLAPDGRYLVGLLFAEGTTQVMETQAKVSLGSPLFIRGPDWRDGQIVIVVMLLP